MAPSLIEFSPRWSEGSKEEEKEKRGRPIRKQQGHWLSVIEIITRLLLLPLNQLKTSQHIAGLIRS